MIIVEPASPADCPALAATSKGAFESDTAVGAPGPGGPPGYDSVAWHEETLTWGRVFRVTERPGGPIIGGAILIPQSPTHVEVGRVWLAPQAQGQGLGLELMRLVEAAIPEATRWTLDTPCWNRRTRAFYRRCGYTETHVDADLVHFEKQT